MPHRQVESPDVRRADRVPPGQKRTDDFPVLHEGKVPDFGPEGWSLRLDGLVASTVTLRLADLKALPSARLHADLHCVTGWSRLDNYFEGVQARELAVLCRPDRDARAVMVSAPGGFAANLALEDFLADDVVFAWAVDGAPVAPEHGGPVRLVVPRLYLWKSVKWPTRVEFVAEEKRGYWESRGYHFRGDPWTEQRHSKD